MAVSRATSDGLTDELTALYRALENELAAGIARRLAKGLGAEDWQTQKLAATGEVRRWIDNTVRRATGKTAKLARGAMSLAFERGAGEAQRELAGRRHGNIASVQRDLPGAQAINRLASGLAGRLEGTHLPIVRSAVDGYRAAVAAPSALVLGGALTRAQAAERAWNEVLDQGFTGFTDARGRRWSAAGYVEMATRTATAQAAVQGHLDRLGELGVDLVIVSDASQECRLCRPWEGKVLTRGPGQAGTIEAESELTGEPVTVRIAGSLSEAIAGGLFHPNCRHSVSAYLPGLTKAPKDTADPDGDRARQQLRYLERETRKWKLRESGALTPEAKAKAAAKVKARQQQIGAHVKANDLTRRRDREQLDLGNKRRTLADESRPGRQPSVGGDAGGPTANPVAGRAAARNTLQQDLESGIKSSRQLGGGAMGRVDLLELNNGTKVVKKVTRDSAGRPSIDQQDAEELGALVTRAAGGRAPRVLRTGRDEVHMDYVEGEIYDDLDAAAVERLDATDEARRLALSDVLMGNVDRNPGNLIIDSKGVVHGIDHGAAFDWHEGLNPPKGPLNGYNTLADLIMDTAGELKTGIVTKAEAAQMRKALEALEPEFRARKRAGWYGKMLQRLKVIEKAAR